MSALKPLLNEGDFSRVESLAKIFEKDEGLALDKQLRELDATNYITGKFKKIFKNSVLFKKNVYFRAMV
jgi:hypothetical protein